MCPPSYHYVSIVIPVLGHRVIYKTFKDCCCCCIILLISCCIQVVDLQQKRSAANTDGYILPVPYTVIRLHDIGPPIAFSSLKASYYG